MRTSCHGQRAWRWSGVAAEWQLEDVASACKHGVLTSRLPGNSSRDMAFGVEKFWDVGRPGEVVGSGGSGVWEGRMAGSTPGMAGLLRNACGADPGGWRMMSTQAGAMGEALEEHR